MKLSKKTLIFSVLCAINIAFAEDSGAFVGANIGYGDVFMQTNTSATEDNGDPTKSHKGKLAGGGGVSYGIIVGYKQFFNPYLGLRYYANLNALHSTLSPTALMVGHAGVSAKQKLTLLNYGVNVDFLWNFIANNALDFGVFVGVGIGANSWFGADLENYPAKIKTANQITQGAWRVEKTHFNAWANVGLRTNIARHHGLEIFARIPFLRDTILKKNESITGMKWSIETSLKNRYGVGVRYNFTF